MSDELMTDGVEAIIAEARKTKETAERMANGDGSPGEADDVRVLAGMVIRSPSRWSGSRASWVAARRHWPTRSGHRHLTPKQAAPTLEDRSAPLDGQGGPGQGRAFSAGIVPMTRRLCRGGGPEAELAGRTSAPLPKPRRSK